MRWSPKGKELRRIRTLLGWTQRHLARSAGLSLRTVQVFESAPLTAAVRPDTVARLAAAVSSGVKADPSFSDQQRATGIAPADIASRHDDEETARPESPPAPEPRPPAPPPAPVVALTARSIEADRKHSIRQSAAIERKLGRHIDTATLPSGTYPLLGPTRLIRLDATFAQQGGKPYAVTGTITALERIKGMPARVLEAERGLGAVMVRIDRTIAGPYRGEHLSTNFFALFAGSRAA